MFLLRNITFLGGPALSWVSKKHPPKRGFLAQHEKHVPGGRLETLRQGGTHYCRHPHQRRYYYPLPHAENAVYKTHFYTEGALFTAAGVRRGKCDVTLVSFYLRDTEGTARHTNSRVLADLIAYILTVLGPWIIGGDFSRFNLLPRT